MVKLQKDQHAAVPLEDEMHKRVSETNLLVIGDAIHLFEKVPQCQKLNSL